VLWLPEAAFSKGHRAAHSFAAAVEACPIPTTAAVARAWGRSPRTCDRHCVAMAGAPTGTLLRSYAEAFVTRERGARTPMAFIAAMLGYSGERALRQGYANRGISLPPRGFDLAEIQPGLAEIHPYPGADSDRRIPPARNTAGDRAGEPEFDGAGPPLS
jgi:hypothetical protein